MKIANFCRDWVRQSSISCTLVESKWVETMSIERAEQLKKELTDQWVRVVSDEPELKRFANSVGQVRTVNMNCRALVEFFGDKDESWYDIAPETLEITDKPDPKPVSKVRKAPKSAVVKQSAAVKQDSEQKASGDSIGASDSLQSPLDKIRAGSAVEKTQGAVSAAEPEDHSPVKRTAVESKEQTD